MILLQLFFSFIQVGLFCVGGGYASIPLIQAQVVDGYHMMSMAEFTDLITIAEMTPGPISLNAATFVGNRIAGIPGGIICSVGCILPSFCICLLLAYVYFKYQNFGGVQIVLGALRPAVVALIGSAGLSILFLALFQSEMPEAVLSDFRPIEAVLFVGGLFLLRKFKVSPIRIIFGTGVVGTILFLITGG